MAAVLYQTVPFVHPAIAGIALLSGLIPVVIHLINRQRHRRIRWAAMSFLLAANRRSARRLRFEQWLLMLARIALVMLFGLAVARPFIPARLGRAGSLLAGTRVHRVLLLDNSLSMNTQTAAGSRFDSAKACALRLVASFPADDPVSLVTLAAGAEAVIDHPAFDRRYIRERLNSVKQVQRTTDTVGALAITQEILEASEAAPGNRVVYLISDFQRRDWVGTSGKTTTEDGTPAGPSGSPVVADTPTETLLAMRLVADALGNPATDLNLIRVYAPSRVAGAAGGDDVERVGPRGNVVVADLACESTLNGVDWPVRISARLCNFGTSTARGLTLQWRRDGRIVRDERVPAIAPGGSTIMTATMSFSRVGTHAIEARIVTRGGGGSSGSQDVTPANSLTLPDDDARYLSLEIRESTSVLVVDGRPGVRLLDGEAGFLATALAPQTVDERVFRIGGLSLPGAPASAIGVSNDKETTQRAPSLVAPKVISRDEIGAEALSEYDVVALCNVPGLSSRQWQGLEEFTGGGRGLLIFCGDLIDADNYNRFGYVEGNGLLPGRIAARSVARRLPPAAEASGAFRAGGNLVHPMVAQFADHPTSGLFSPTARVDRYLPFDCDRRRAEVLLEYINGDPAWVASTYKKGRVLLCTTTANMGWNNLPAKGDYVSLMIEAVAFLAPQHGRHRNLRVGQTIREPLSAVEATMSLGVAADDSQPVASTSGALAPHGDSLALEYGPVERAGFVELSIGPHKRAVAVNVDPVESDIAGVSTEDELAGLDRPFRWMTDREIGAGTSDAGRATELATIPFCLVFMLLLVELWMGMWFGRSRSVSTGEGVRTRRRHP